MLKLIRLPMGLLALTVAVPVMAQPAATTTPGTTAPSSATAPGIPGGAKGPTEDTHGNAMAPKTAAVDINSATAAELKALPGITESDAAKIIQGRPYHDKTQLVSKKVVSEPTYEKIRDHVVAKQSKS